MPMLLSVLVAFLVSHLKLIIFNIENGLFTFSNKEGVCVNLAIFTGGSLTSNPKN